MSCIELEKSIMKIGHSIGKEQSQIALRRSYNKYITNFPGDCYLTYTEWLRDTLTVYQGAKKYRENK